MSIYISDHAYKRWRKRAYNEIKSVGQPRKNKVAYKILKKQIVEIFSEGIDIPNYLARKFKLYKHSSDKDTKFKLATKNLILFVYSELKNKIEIITIIKINEEQLVHCLR